ncbi:MAG: holo-ACP synthase [Chlamydiales bacterium]
MMQKTYPESIIGIGTDIIAIHRIKKAVHRHGERFIDRLFTEKERAYCTSQKDPFPRYTGRFAAKEAIVKTLGIYPDIQIQWREIEILNDTCGKPEVYLSKRLQEVFLFHRFFISISHCKDYATAMALLVGGVDEKT